MDLKLKLNSQKIVDKEFRGKKPGYDPLEVDEFLDVVITDYVQMEKYINEVNKTINELQKTCKIYNLNKLYLKRESTQIILNKTLTWIIAGKFTC